MWIVREGPLFFGERTGCEKLPQKIPAQQKNAGKWYKGNNGKKHLASAFYYHYNVKKLLVHKLLATKIIMYSLSYEKSKPQKIIAYPLPFTKIMVNPHVCFIYFLIYNLMPLNWVADRIEGRLDRLWFG